MFNAIESFVLDANIPQFRKVGQLGIFPPLCAAEAWSALKIHLKFTEVTEGRDYSLPSQKTSCLLRLNIISNALWFMLNTAASSRPACHGVVSVFTDIIPFEQCNNRMGKTGYVFLLPIYRHGNLIERVTDWMSMELWSYESYDLPVGVLSCFPNVPSNTMIPNCDS